MSIPVEITIPSLADVHVHFRQPGYSHKETILTGCNAAVSSGYTAVCPMPNLDPVPDSVEHLGVELDIIRRDAVIDVIPYASITIGRKGLQVVDVASLKGLCAGFSDDGSGVQDEETMFRAMQTIASADSILAAHCEDTSYDGSNPKSEWGPIERDISLAQKTGCRYHVCHISSARSVELIRRAKARGVDISCETAPHYLLLSLDDVRDEGKFRMNPPIRSAEDRSALIEGLLDGTIDMISTDHAPHTAEEKSRGYAASAMGIVGLETAFPVLYTHFVRSGILSMERLVELMSIAPRRRFRLPLRGGDTAVFNLSTPWKLDPSEFRSMGRSTPFDGWEVYGKCLRTSYKGKEIFNICQTKGLK